MIFILTNIKFGHPKLSKYQLDFFHDFIQTLMKSGSKEHEVIINGDFFYNNKHTTFNLINEVKRILGVLTQFSNVFMIGNDYCYPLFNEYIKVVDKLNFDIKDISLFQLSKESTDQIGYNIVKDNKIKFIPNKFSPRFVEYIIKEIDDIDQINITKDFIDITINSELLDKAEYKNKIDIFLNNNQFNNVFYTENTKVDNKVKLDSKNINIRNILVNNIEDELKEELGEIFVIYDEKNNNLI